MPIYTYSCQSCGVQFEKLQKFSDKPLTRCPECRKGRVRRLVQPSAIVFKGSGWYATDHRSASAVAKASGKKTESEGAAEKSDSKPAKPEKKETASAKTDD